MKRLTITAFILLAAVLLRAQDAQPRIRFSLDFPDSPPPESYVITLESNGEGHYRSWSRDDAKPYERTIKVGEAMRARTFELARMAGYFQGDFDYRKHRIAFTGNKTLRWEDGAQSHETRYNWSENGAISELTQIFTGIAGTVECGPRLEHLRRFDKLGLDAELKGMEEMQKAGYLRELHLIAPQLESIAGDSSILNLARQRARRLLEIARAESQPATAEAHPQASPGQAK